MGGRHSRYCMGSGADGRLRICRRTHCQLDPGAHLDPTEGTHHENTDRNLRNRAAAFRQRIFWSGRRRCGRPRRRIRRIAGKQRSRARDELGRHRRPVRRKAPAVRPPPERETRRPTRLTVTSTARSKAFARAADEIDAALAHPRAQKEPALEANHSPADRIRHRSRGRHRAIPRPAPQNLARSLMWGADEHVLCALAAGWWLYCQSKGTSQRDSSDVLLTTVVSAAAPHLLKNIFDQTGPDRRTIRGHLRGIRFFGKIFRETARCFPLRSRRPHRPTGFRLLSFPARQRNYIWAAVAGLSLPASSCWPTRQPMSLRALQWDARWNGRSERSPDMARAPYPCCVVLLHPASSLRVRTNPSHHVC
jgi:hypothetical protein